MKIKLTQVILLLIISIFFASCKRQATRQESQSQFNSQEIGKQVAMLTVKIWAVYQDKKGNYWFGSNGEGLYFFDGKILKQFTRNDGLVDNSIRGIQEDQAGNIFIETPDGVSKFDGKTFSTLEVAPSSSSDWKLKPDDLWFNCNGNLNNVYRYDGAYLYELQLPKKDIETVLGIYQNESSYSPYTVYGIDKDKKGNVWFGTILAGAFRYDGTSFLWIGEKELSRLKDGREPGVRSMLEDTEGNMWLSNFMSKYKINEEDFVEYVKLQGIESSNALFEERLPYFNSGLVAKNGDLWMTTYGGGVWKYDGENLSNFPIENGESTIYLISIYQDNDGTLWLGTDNDGVYKRTGETFEKFKPKSKI